MLTQLGKYRILNKIDQGGMGTVYRALDPQLGRTVALKVLSHDLSASLDFVERFRREAITAANLHHQNIVTVFETGVDDGQHYIAMEYVDGRDLHKVIRTEGRMDLERVGALLAQVAAALDYAYQLGVVHRDIKPGNILLNERDEVKLVDFGIARALSAASRLTGSQIRMGTPQYTSPEQAEGAPGDARSDIYSLGIVVYELLTGQVPFVAETTDAVLYAHIHTPPRPLREQRQNIPPRVEQVVMKALAKKPEDRYQTAGEFAHAYQEAFVKSATQARRPQSAARRALPLIALMMCAALAVYFSLRAAGAFLAAAPAAITPAISPTSLSAGAPAATHTLPRPTEKPTATRPPLTAAHVAPIATPAKTPTATLATLSAQGSPMATLLPTWTPTVIPSTPTVPVKPQPSALPPTTGRKPSPGLITVLPPRISQPADNTAGQGRVLFSWTPAAELPSDAAYEVVWWEEAAALDSARGIASPTRNTEQECDLSSLGVKRIHWTVLVVKTNPYKRLTKPGDGVAHTLAVCQQQEATCTRTVVDAEGNTTTESYDCSKQICP